jgi:hypothetical protein
MFFARIGTVLLLVSAALAKSPPDSSTVCDRYQRSDLIFTGSAEDAWITLLDTHKSPMHKRSEKSKRIRFLVREWYKGQRQDTVEIWMTPSDCPLTIEANQMYLIYARVNKENGRTESNACTGTTPAATATADLTYLNASLRGPGRATQISGTAGSEGLNIQAKSGIDIRYAITDGAGRFTFDGLPPADWSLSVNGGSPQQVHLTPDACISADLAH